MSDYFTYSFYLHETEDFQQAKLLVDTSDVEGSLKRLGFSESIAAQDEQVEGVSVDQVNGIRLSLMAYKTNPYLLLASQKLGCEFVRVGHESDDSDSQDESYYHRGKKVAEEHVVVLQRVYCPELARSKRLSSVFETRDLTTLKKELADGLDPNSLSDGMPLLFKSVGYPEATRSGC